MACMTETAPARPEKEEKKQEDSGKEETKKDERGH